MSLLSLACPMYIAEVAPAERRGRLGFLYQLAIVLGSLTGVIVAWRLSALIQPQIAWRWMAASSAAPTLVFLTLALRLPPSPRWLLSRGRERDAAAALTRLLGAEHAAGALAQMRAAAAPSPTDRRKACATCSPRTCGGRWRWGCSWPS